jgi:hypothetical protein
MKKERPCMDRSLVELISAAITPLRAMRRTGLVPLYSVIVVTCCVALFVIEMKAYIRAVRDVGSI